MRDAAWLRSFDAEDDPTPLLYTANAEGSHLFRSLPSYVVTTMRDEPITMENHGKGGRVVERAGTRLERAGGRGGWREG